MKIVWTPEAADDLECVLAHIAEQRPSGAIKVAAKIESSIESIQRFPHAGRLDADTGCRERIVSDYPFLLIYTVDDAAEIVEMVAVFHTSRDPATKRRP